MPFTGLPARPTRRSRWPRRPARSEAPRRLAPRTARPGRHVPVGRPGPSGTSTARSGRRLTAASPPRRCPPAAPQPGEIGTHRGPCSARHGAGARREQAGRETEALTATSRRCGGATRTSLPGGRGRSPMTRAARCRPPPFVPDRAARTSAARSGGRSDPPRRRSDISSPSCCGTPPPPPLSAARAGNPGTWPVRRKAPPAVDVSQRFTPGWSSPARARISNSTMPRSSG
jgi:hypothetical protein